MPTKNDKITWTEIAIQLVGEVPASCRLRHDGSMRVRLADGRLVKFFKAEVEQAIDDLSAIDGKAEKPQAERAASKPASQPPSVPPKGGKEKSKTRKKPGPKPKDPSQPSPKGKGGKESK